jgi:hypothetical protein
MIRKLHIAGLEWKAVHRSKARAMHQPLCHNQTEVEKIGEQGNSFE